MLSIEFSVIGISETWLTESNEGWYQISGYNSEHLYRKTKRGGGVSVFIKTNLKYKRRKDLDIINDNAEAIFIEIKKTNSTPIKILLLE